MSQVPPRGRRGVRSGAPGGRGGPPAEGAARGRGRAAPAAGRAQPAAAAAASSEKKDSPPQKGSPPERSSPTAYSETDAAELALELSKMKVTERPGYGQMGRKIPLDTNHFKLEYQKLVAQQYHVECKCPFRKISKEETLQIFWSCVSKNKSIFPAPYNLAFDGSKICFTVDEIQFPSSNKECYTFEVEISLERDDKDVKYTVLWQHVGQVLVDLATLLAGGTDQVQTAIQVLDVVLKQGRSCPYMRLNYNVPFEPAGRSFYRPPQQPDGPPHLFDMKSGKQIWVGHFTSAHIGTNGQPMLNFDLSYTAFFKEIPVIQYMCEVLVGAARGPPRGPTRFNFNQLDPNIQLDDFERRTLSQSLRTLKVYTSHSQSKRTYRIFQVTSTTPQTQKFKTRNEQGEEVESNVAEYFQQKYKYTMKYPNLPIIHCGSSKRPHMLPMELCFLRYAQKSNKKLTEEQTSTMIKVACNAAPERKRKLLQQFTEAKFESDSFCSAFGVKVDSALVNLEGRVLEAPKLEYKRGGRPNQVAPREGTWRLDNSTGFYECSGTKQWAIVSFVRQDKQRDIEYFCQELSKHCSGMGIQMPEWPNYVEYVSRAEQVEATFRKILDKDPDVRLIVVPIAFRNTQIYGEVKRVAETLLGVATQCLVSKTLFSPKPATLGFFARKINAKLGGINVKLVPSQITRKFICEQATLVLGVDVTHPGPSDASTPSIASIVGNIDMLPFKFGATIKVQKEKRDHIIKLTDAVRDRIVRFYQATSQKPGRIIVYRDGVSEGEYKKVLREELPGIREACKNLEEAYKPPITFINVQKRHHTRLFCQNPRDMCGKAQNVPPGTVVDRDILHPNYFEFFLVSHFGLQGTSRPTKYIVLHDDNRMTADEVQSITYDLCHIYARCDRAVSIPAPVYYADLACTRARFHMQKTLGDTSSDEASSHSDHQTQSSVPEHELQQSVTVSDGFDCRMYYV